MLGMAESCVMRTLMGREVGRVSFVAPQEPRRLRAGSPSRFVTLLEPVSPIRRLMPYFAQ
jgi:hypothetical protein